MSPAAALRLSCAIAVREMRGGPRGFGVFLASLFLGVFAVAAVGSFAAAARAGLLADARALLGGDVELTLSHRPLSQEQAAWLATEGAVSEVLEMRVMAAAGGAAGGRPVLTELKAVDPAYPLVGRVDLQGAASLAEALEVRGGMAGAVAEDALLHRLGLSLGDRIAVGEARYEVRAVLLGEPDRSVRLFTLGPRLLVSRDSLGATGLLVPGSLVRYSYRLRFDAPQGREALASWVEALHRRYPAAGWRVATWDRAAPRLRYFLDRMATNLTLVGLAALLVGGLGVAGAVRGYLTGKLAHIAVMKCVGGHGRVVAGAYLLQILALGSAASAAGLALGAAVPWGVAAVLGPNSPVPVRPGLSLGALWPGAVFGLLVALAFSVESLDAARRVPPSVLFRARSGTLGSPGWRSRAVALLAVAGLVAVAAVATGDPRLTFWSAAGAGACFVLFRGLASGLVLAARRVPRPRDPRVRLALGSIGRPGGPARTMVFSVGLGLTALVAVAVVQANLSSLVERTLPEEAPSFFAVEILPEQAGDFEGVARGVAGVRRVDRVPTLRGRIVRIDGVPVSEADVRPEVSWAVRGDRFLTYSGTPPEGSKVSKGTWWSADYSGPPQISLAADIAEGFGVDVGDTLTLNVLGREITATIANLREVEWSTLALNFAVVFAPGVLEGAPRTELAAIYASPEADGAVFDALTGRFSNVSLIAVKEVLQNVGRVLSHLGTVFRSVAGLVLGIGFLVLAGALASDQRGRIRDAVIFKVCGATRRDVLGAFATEFLVLGVGAGILAAALGTGAAWAVVVGLMDAPFAFPAGTVAGTALAGVVLTVVLGLVGTARVLGKRPAPFLRGE